MQNILTYDSKSKVSTVSQITDKEREILYPISEQQIKENSELEVKAEARTAAEAKLLALGLTTEDLKALLG
jgi:hypothetical protein